MEYNHLAKRIYRENEDSLGQLRVALRQLGAAGGLTGEGTAMNSRLIGQLEEVQQAVRLMPVGLCTVVTDHSVLRYVVYVQKQSRIFVHLYNKLRR